MTSKQIVAWIGLVLSLVNLLWVLSKELRTRKSIRTMICVEIEENLARLNEFRSNTENASTFSKSPLSEVQKNDALRLNALSTLGHSVWRSLTTSIPTALNPNQIRSVYRFHARLDELAVLKERHNAAPSEHAAAIKEALTRLIEDGNPLKAPPKTGRQP